MIGMIVIIMIMIVMMILNGGTPKSSIFDSNPFDDFLFPSGTARRRVKCAAAVAGSTSAANLTDQEPTAGGDHKWLHQAGFLRMQTSGYCILMYI